LPNHTAPERGPIELVIMEKLFIVVKNEYFQQILAGTKTEEYRRYTRYWISRVVGREYSHIIFQNGFKKHERVEVSYLGYEVQALQRDFFGPFPVKLFILKIALDTDRTLSYNGHVKQT